MAERLFDHLTIDGDEAKLDGAVIKNLENNEEFSELKSGLNLFNVGIACKRNSSVDTTQDGIKYIYNGEYWVLDGTCTGSNQVYLLNSPNELPSSIKPGETAYVCFETDIVGVKARIWPFVDGEQQSVIYDSSKSGEVVIPEGTTGIKIALFTSNGTKATNQTVLYYLLTRKPLYETQNDLNAAEADIVEIRADMAETNENLTKAQTDLDETKDTVKQVASINLFNIDTVETGVYLEANGRKYFTDAGGITDFIGVQSDNYAVAFSLGAGTTNAWYLRIHGYDSNKQWVAQISTYLMQAGQTGDIFHQFAVPSGISYIKVSVYFYAYTSNLQIGKSDNGVIVTAIDRVARNSIEGLSNRIELFDFSSPEFPMNEFKRTAIDFYASFDAITNWETMSSLSDVKQFGVYNGGYVDSHIANYQDYALRAYFINGRSNYMAFVDGDTAVTNNYYRLNSTYTGSGLPNARPEGFYPRKKIMIVSGMHGDEGGTPNYLKEFIRKLVNEKDFCTFFADYDFCIIPLASPYAFSIDRRETRYFNESTGQIETFNLNRDFPVDGSTPVTNEAKFIESVFNANEYDFVIDLHMLTWDSSADDVRQGFGCVDTSLTSDTAVEKFYRAISEAGEKTERTIKSFYELDRPQQTTLTWEGIAGSGVNQFIDYAIGRNYTGSRHKADYVLMTETSTYCHYYSNSAIKYNQISCSFGSNFNENVLKNVLSLFADL